MSGTGRARVRAAAAAAIVFAGAASALAQDYTVTTGATAQYLEAKPAGATLVNVSSILTTPGAVSVTLPFEFPYYGRLHSTAVVSAHGMIIPGGVLPIANIY